MKLSLSFAAGLLAVGLLGATSMAGTILGSPHDFGAQTWSGNQICMPCHTPHNGQIKDANGVLLNGPMWNHKLSTATYTLYSQMKTDATGALVVDPVTKLVVTQAVTGNVDQNSKLCLSCHDGTVALDSFNNKDGVATTGSQNFTNTKDVLTSDLSTSHPIGDAAMYPTTDGKASTDPKFARPDKLSTVSISLRPMANGKLAVGCTSCHNPHNSKLQQHLLVMNNSGAGTTGDGRAVNGSLLCQNCHIR